MNKTTEALKLAEEALEELHYSSGTVKAVTLYKSAIAAIREALAEQEKQEPVGVFANVNALTPEKGTRWEQMVDSAYDGVKYIHLYAAPVSAKRELVELTDYEIVRLYAESPMCDSEMIDFARAVIAAFKEKNK